MPYTPPPPPAPPSTAGGAKPLGVPAGYVANRPGAGTANVFGVAVPVPTSSQPARYYAGHEFKFAGRPPEEIVQVQRMLAGAGLIGPKTDFRLGVWDDASATAYRKLLEFANVNGYDEAEALQVYAQAPEINAGGVSGSGALPRARLSNPDDLAQIVDTVSKATLGRRVDPSFVQRFISAYQRAELDESTAANATGGGAFVSAPDPQTMAEQMLRQEQPGAAFRTDAQNTMAALSKVLMDPTASFDN